MKAKDLLTTDIGKWVVIRFEITEVDEDEDETAPLVAKPEGTSFLNHIHRDTTLEFTDPPPPVQEVGDVFNAIGKKWTVAAIDGNVCLLRSATGSHVSEDYPLNQKIWTFVRKGPRHERHNHFRNLRRRRNTIRGRPRARGRRDLELLDEHDHGER